MQVKGRFAVKHAMSHYTGICGSLRLVGMFCFLTTLALASPSISNRQSGPEFTPDERTEIVRYWSLPSRYTMSEPASVTTRGVWQVRLTPSGSLWLWNLYRGKKSAASLMGGAPPPLPGSSAGWESWIGKRIKHDRWKALQGARSSNAGSGEMGLPAVDRDTPEIEPENPGPIPAGLLSYAGDPPSFAEAVQPRHYVVSFDDGSFDYEDNVRLSSPRYAYYRSSDGVMSPGVPLRKLDPTRFQRLLELAGCDLSRSRVLKAVSQLEGGFDSVNTYDTGFVSVGFIQFASLKEGAGSLGAVLALYKGSDPQGFNSDFHRFGVDVTSDGTLDVIDPSTGLEVSGCDANTKIIDDKRLIAVFQRAGQKSDAFCATQLKAAIAQYYPCDDKLCFSTTDGLVFNGRVGDVIRSEAGMATLFDRKVNTGNINALARVSSQVACAHHCQDLAQLAKYEKEIVAGMRYRMDFTQDLSLSQPSGSR
jgi:hypothetical protein